MDDLTYKPRNPIDVLFDPPKLPGAKMPRKFKTIEDMFDAMNIQRAKDVAESIVRQIRDLGFKAPETLLDNIHGIAQDLDELAECLAIDHERKRIFTTFFSRAETWLEDKSLREVTVKPMGNGRIRLRFRDDTGKHGEFESSAMLLLPHLGRALLGEVPPDLEQE